VNEVLLRPIELTTKTVATRAGSATTRSKAVGMLKQAEQENPS